VFVCIPIKCVNISFIAQAAVIITSTHLFKATYLLHDESLFLLALDFLTLLEQLNTTYLYSTCFMTSRTLAFFHLAENGDPDRINFVLEGVDAHFNGELSPLPMVLEDVVLV
jgi:hypothetical protein